MLEALISLLAIILVSIMINKVATAALRRTGLSREVASFQAQSAFSGVGFTTSESEYVVNHPVRRRIIRLLMLLGSAGLAGVIASLILTFAGQSLEGAALRLGILLAGLAALWLLARSEAFDRAVSPLIEWLLDRFTDIRPVDYEALLQVGRGYTIALLKVSQGNWLAGKTLGEAGLIDEGILVLGVYRRVNGKVVYHGAPGPRFRVEPGDELIIYGHETAVASLAGRPRGAEGDRRHREIVEAHRARRAVELAEMRAKV